MSNKPIGTIVQLNRYPVKSFAGESLASCRVDAHGLYGDRARAFIDDTKDGWDRYYTARDYAGMLEYKAKLAREGSEQAFPPVEITGPDGRIYEWNDKLLARIQTHARNKLTMVDYAPGNEGLLAVDSAGILIITDESLRLLERLWGKELDKRRFRANIVLAIDKDAGHEREWIGKRLSVGEVRLQIHSECERCSMITIDPDRLEKDSTLLRTVNEKLGLSFGVYASVEHTGRLAVGDAVYMTE
ncbi:MOSC domain-containing protein [Paenibacillus harenae]|uniref:MOSC domain-containing protein n=1 Tax=Paenibacillus harenae TaxID=306543 RepID=UPI0027D8CFF0|nr:MOSC domain-containing protein [Paenibacillus harenae]